MRSKIGYTELGPVSTVKLAIYQMRTRGEYTTHFRGFEPNDNTVCTHFWYITNLPLMVGRCGKEAVNKRGPALVSLQVLKDLSGGFCLIAPDKSADELASSLSVLNYFPTICGVTTDL